MQLTYDDSFGLTDADELAPEETQDIPFFGFITGTVISLGLWSVMAWIVWVLVA